MTGDIVKKEDMVYGKLSDLEMASKVRMLFRDTLEHEAVCCGARDRIMYLSQEVERRIAAHKIDVEHLQKEIAELRSRTFARFAGDECWIYQGDGTDNLESLVCPVVIRPEVLRRIIDMVEPHH